VPVVLDTDHLSILLQKSQPSCDRLLARLDSVAPDDIATAIVCFQEQVQGWLAYLNRAKTDAHVLRAYTELDGLCRWFSRMNILPFNAAALRSFHSLRKQCRRVGTLDLRIASIALTTEATLLSRNLRDFGQVPGLRVEDWTK
jgi:tRNA(fMet)-specific endonuclease VapC